MRFARALLADDDEAEALFQLALDADLRRLAVRSRPRPARLRGMAPPPAPRGRVPRSAPRGPRRVRRARRRRWGERARQELRASGETSRPRTPEVRDRLTPQELQIAQLAAEGLSNREIGHRLYLSHRTVGSHLYRIFPKLGIAARDPELRDALDAAASVT